MSGFLSLKSSARLVNIASVAFCIAACQQPKLPTPPRGTTQYIGSLAPTHTISRAECLRIADAYATFKWKASPSNVLHGADLHGTRVDTPDHTYRPAGGFAGWWQPTGWNEGMPYKWGGFDTLDSFDQGIKKGLPAGDAFTALKRDQNDAAVSKLAVGVDCSGFVARCWRMKAPFSTYDIPKHCDMLPNYDALRPGDVVNKEHEHISLFVCFDDDKHEIMTVYDAGCPPNLRVMKHGIYTSYIKARGYQAWRYRGMID